MELNMELSAGVALSQKMIQSVEITSDECA